MNNDNNDIEMIIMIIIITGLSRVTTLSSSLWPEECVIASKGIDQKLCNYISLNAIICHQYFVIIIILSLLYHYSIFFCHHFMIIIIILSLMSLSYQFLSL
jgi:hypothetical protein